MTIKFTPESGSQTYTEFTDFSLTVTIEDEVEPADPPPEPLPPDYVPPTPETPATITVISVKPDDSGVTGTFSGSTFTLSGQYIDAFERELRYLDTNNVEKVAKKFEDIERSYNALIKYIAPSEFMTSSFANVTYNTSISTSEVSSQYEVNVIQNFTAANEKLKAVTSVAPPPPIDSGIDLGIPNLILRAKF